MKTINRAEEFLPVRSLKCIRPERTLKRLGLTLVEMSVVLLALGLLATLFFAAARAWTRGADRTQCIINIEAVQKGVRGFANMSGFRPGAIVSGLESKVVASGDFFAEVPDCPATGSYEFGGDQIPGMGELYMTCSLQTTQDHAPEDAFGW